MVQNGNTDKSSSLWKECNVTHVPLFPLFPFPFCPLGIWNLPLLSTDSLSVPLTATYYHLLSTHTMSSPADPPPLIHPVHPLNILVIGGSSGIGLSIVHRLACSPRNHRIFFTYFSNAHSSTHLRSLYPHLDIQSAFLDQGDFLSILALVKKVDLWLRNPPPAHSNRASTATPRYSTKLDLLINNAALGSGTVKKYIQFQKSKHANSPSQSNTSPHHSNPLAFSFDPNHDPNTNVALTLLDMGMQLKQKNVKQNVPDWVAEDEALLRVNALGPLWVTKALIPLMNVKNVNQSVDEAIDRSSVVFIGSVGGSTSVFPQYTPSDLMSKSAVSYLSRHLAAVHTHTTLDILCLSPGATHTSMFESSTLSKMTSQDRQKFVSGMPKGRLIKCDEIATCLVNMVENGLVRLLHGSVIDASMGLGVRPGLQTEVQDELIQSEQKAVPAREPTTETVTLNSNPANTQHRQSHSSTSFSSNSPFSTTSSATSRASKSRPSSIHRHSRASHNHPTTPLPSLSTPIHSIDQIKLKSKI
ncbi:hypothetical protein BKA69DRAFT_1047832 [Paraphysoderma sedebokerense]|nr:hypothetical protein BKA69DRAFT_1047774 [Paraphysoderma sedebokerense]KAI9145476.1 hypothetical protein BKA69DRAFT_1047832 [Paraphysoderma sedebokerense]